LKDEINFSKLIGTVFSWYNYKGINRVACKEARGRVVYNKPPRTYWHKFIGGKGP